MKEKKIPVLLSITLVLLPHTGQCPYPDMIFDQ